MNTYFIIYCAVLVLLGAAYCFFGYRLLRILMSAAGFVLGFSLGMTYIDAPALTAVLVSVLIGLAAAALLYFVYNIGVFAAGACFGAAVAKAAISAFALPSTGLAAIVIVAVLGLLGGILALVVKRIFLVICTSFLGAGLTVNGVVLFVTGHSAGVDVGSVRKIALSLRDVSFTEDYVYLIAALALGLMGALVQLFKTAKKK